MPNGENDDDPRTMFTQALRAGWHEAGRPAHHEMADRVNDTFRRQGVNWKVDARRIGEWLNGRRVPQKFEPLWEVIRDLAEMRAKTRPEPRLRPPAKSEWKKRWEAASRHRQTPPGTDLARGNQRPTTTALGWPLDEVPGPFELGVHRSVTIENQQAELPDLPLYVPREHDRELRRLIVHAHTSSQLVVLVGKPSTGKTRTCWEAAQQLPEGWRLWHPLSPSRPEALIAGLAGENGQHLEPRTVVWLDELQRYLAAPDTALRERAAAALRELLRDAGRGPVLLLATLWPDYWPQIYADREVRATIPAAGGMVEVPENFYGHEETVTEASTRDPRWQAAVQESPDRCYAQFLAGGPALIERYTRAAAAEKAIMDAASDARRMGHPPALSVDFLRLGAEGFLHHDDWARLSLDQRENWFSDALTALGQPVRGTPGPLGAPHGGITQYVQLTEYLDYHLGLARWFIAPSASMWVSAADVLTDPAVLKAMAASAEQRGRYRHAASLYRAAVDVGDTLALRGLGEQRERAEDTAGAIQLYQRAVDGGDEGALPGLARTLSRAGHPSDAQRTTWKAIAAGFGGVEMSLRPRFATPVGAALEVTHGNTAPRTSEQQEHEEMLLRIGDADITARYSARAEQGDAAALFALAKVQRWKRDLEAAAALCLRAAQAGAGTTALQELASLDEERGDLTAAAQLHLQLLDAGHHGAIANVARVWADKGEARRMMQFGLTAAGAPEQPW
jgi:tetratricopeptide (TPR) repeat protein